MVQDPPNSGSTHAETVRSPPDPTGPADPTDPISGPAGPARPRRIASVDILRGFDMFWIVGADLIVRALAELRGWGWLGAIATQLDHRPWQGVTAYDVAFPLFLFIVGVSIVLSMAGRRDRPLDRQDWWRIGRRTLLLFVLGLIYSGGLREGWDQIRWLGVLQRIAIAYAVGAVLFRVLRPRGLAITAGAILLGYWAAMALWPIRDVDISNDALTAQFGKADPADAERLYQATDDYVRGGFDKGRNLANHLDLLLLPGRKYDGAFDPEGLFSTLPAIVSTLLGLLAGLLLIDRRLTDRQRPKWLAIAGLGLLLVGHLWGLAFPIVKQLWTSSYVLVTAGWSCLLLAGAYQVVDIRGHHRWGIVFLWIGMNPITIYMARKLVDFKAIAERLVGGPVAQTLGPYGELLVASVALALMIWLVRFLYQRKIFLRV